MDRDGDGVVAFNDFKEMFYPNYFKVYKKTTASNTFSSPKTDKIIGMFRKKHLVPTTPEKRLRAASAKKFPNYKSVQNSLNQTQLVVSAKAQPKNQLSNSSVGLSNLKDKNYKDMRLIYPKSKNSNDYDYNPQSDREKEDRDIPSSSRQRLNSSNKLQEKSHIDYADPNSNVNKERILSNLNLYNSASQRISPRQRDSALNRTSSREKINSPERKNLSSNSLNMDHNSLYFDQNKFLKGKSLNNIAYNPRTPSKFKFETYHTEYLTKFLCDLIKYDCEIENLKEALNQRKDLNMNNMFYWFDYSNRGYIGTLEFKKIMNELDINVNPLQINLIFERFNIYQDKRFT